jgi:hypothetical protein
MGNPQGAFDAYQAALRRGDFHGAARAWAMYMSEDAAAFASRNGFPQPHSSLQPKSLAQCAEESLSLLDQEIKAVERLAGEEYGQEGGPNTARLKRLQHDRLVRAVGIQRDLREAAAAEDAGRASALAPPPKPLRDMSRAATMPPEQQQDIRDRHTWLIANNQPMAAAELGQQFADIIWPTAAPPTTQGGTAA